MQRNQRRRVQRALLVALTLGLSACGGVTKFSDTTAIAVKGPAPEAPPAAPPKIALSPALKPKRVEVMADRIDIKEKIQFELDKATIKSESNDLLDEITKVFSENPQIKKVEIIGHTSDEGADKYNKTLSEKRAQAVVAYLTSHGIDKNRLVAKGLGESKPIADNKSEEGKEKNRRVEFLIVEQDVTMKKVGEK